MLVSNRYHAGLHDTYSTHLPQALSENCPVVPVRGTAKPLARTDVPKPLPYALQAGNSLLHPLIAHWNLPSLSHVEGVRIPIRLCLARDAPSAPHPSPPRRADS